MPPIMRICRSFTEGLVRALCSPALGPWTPDPPSKALSHHLSPILPDSGDPSYTPPTVPDPQTPPSLPALLYCSMRRACPGVCLAWEG